MTDTPDVQSDAHSAGYHKAWRTLANLLAVASVPVCIALSGVLWDMRSIQSAHQKEIDTLQEREDELQQWIINSTKDRYTETEANHDLGKLEENYNLRMNDFSERIKFLERLYRPNLTDDTKH